MGKVGKDQANYRDGAPGWNCGTCDMFDPNRGKCDLVLARKDPARPGPITPDKVCDNWVPMTRGKNGLTEKTIAPLEQRALLRNGLVNVRETRRCPLEFEMREVPDGSGGTNITFTGYACVTGADYAMEDFLGGWTERVAPGAFKKTLSDGADVMFLVNHEGMPLARTKSGTLRLAEHTAGDVTGLHAEAQLDTRDYRVQSLRYTVERGDMDEMSFAFRVPKDRQEWNEDYDDRTILECNLANGDVSLVNYGANPHTAGHVALRSRGDERDWRSIYFELLEGELRAGKKLSAATMDAMGGVMKLVKSADDAVDQALADLSDLMGVANPDEPATPAPSSQKQQNSRPGDGIAVARARLAHARAR